MRLPAQYFDGRSSAATAAEVEVLPNASLRILRSGQPVLHVPLAEIEITPRLGKVPRELRFRDGAVCAIADNDALDRELAAVRGGGAGWVHTLERSWGWVLGGLVITAAALLLFVSYGIPTLARIAAERLPVDVDRALGERALDMLEGNLLQPSKLPPARQAALQAMFADMRRETAGARSLQLELRASAQLGANALALPSGIIIMTDDLAALAEDDHELRGVLAHEIGHVVHRHSLRMVLQNSVVALTSMVLLGDIDASSTLIAALPAVLVNAGHSRGFEAEADAYAYAWLDRHGIARSHYVAILDRLEAEHGDSGEVLSYLSTHPRAADRKAAAAGR